MLTTPDRGWPGFPGFGIRDLLAELPFKVNARQEAVKRMNKSLRELTINWVEVKQIEIDSASDAYEPVYLLTLSYRGKGVDVQQIKL
ncbi:MAG: hypothetical protein L0220_03065 [Acidobacteria bacterium]|nr:hypothetical protein [Acidobacteriota bacterium]